MIFRFRKGLQKYKYFERMNQHCYNKMLISENHSSGLGLKMIKPRLNITEKGSSFLLK
jgi:hypothetical protein